MAAHVPSKERLLLRLFFFVIWQSTLLALVGTGHEHIVLCVLGSMRQRITRLLHSEKLWEELDRKVGEGVR